jgi:hypothetical protein
MIDILSGIALFLLLGLLLVSLKHNVYEEDNNDVH